ncbi:MAG: translation initiation factor IF-2 [Acidobacteria bacterium]|nr:translation initiation factor IF-2 [Acidobacteriota bacterium]
MSKIRINELARELEVKPHRIIDLLPELGVSEKKTHSSSIDEDVALKIRHMLRHEGGEAAGSEHDLGIAVSAGVAEEELIEDTQLSEEEPERRATAPAESAPAAVVAPPAPTAEAEAEKPGAGQAVSAPRPSIPLRPPLAGPISSTPAPRETPIAPPPAPAPATPPPSPAIPPRTIAIPAKPAPTAPPRPGQIISGPRQPLPSAPPPRPAVTTPSAPAPGSVLPGRPKPAAPPPQPPPQASPGRPIVPPPPPARPQVGKPAVLAGQPAARPVVPPRPDLVARLQQTQSAKPAPGQPVARGPMPGRPSSPPAPGQPVYRGPIRPGQPILRPGSQPGAPGGRGPQRPGGRPMHPTTPLRPEVATPVPTTDQQRRDAGKKQRERHREIEVIEKDLRLQRRSEPEQVLATNREITISEGMTVKEFSEKLGIKANLVIKKLVDRKIFATINQTLDVKLAEELASEFGATTTQMTFEEESTFDLEMAEDAADMQLRPPVVTIMGHVDHGKTSLLDAIRKSNVVAGEFGGITQHIGAYQVEHEGKLITFVDTPGHEAFTEMRARGANVTDIVVLVVAADDGVMPQTVEAISHAKAADVPIIIALNKIDLPNVNINRIYGELSQQGLVPEEYGGDTPVVKTSATQGVGIADLLEMIGIVAELKCVLKANPKKNASGTCLEALISEGRGAVARVIVQDGTLRVGDVMVCGDGFGRVRALYDDKGRAVEEAGPSAPVEVSGLDAVPTAGEKFGVVDDIGRAREIAETRRERMRGVSLGERQAITLENLFESMAQKKVKSLNVILKADVQGSLEALTKELEKLVNPEVPIRVLHKAVGGISESDILLADASQAIVIGFRVAPEDRAVTLAEEKKIDIRRYDIIYQVTDEIKKAVEGMLIPEIKEVHLGRAVVRQLFKISKVGTVAGCFVTQGLIERSSKARVLRDGREIYKSSIEALKRFKDDVKEVRENFECGIKIVNFDDLKPDDVIEAYRVDVIRRTL